MHEVQRLTLTSVLDIFKYLAKFTTSRLHDFDLNPSYLDNYHTVCGNAWFNHCSYNENLIVIKWKVRKDGIKKKKTKNNFKSMACTKKIQVPTYRRKTPTFTLTQILVNCYNEFFFLFLNSKLALRISLPLFLWCFRGLNSFGNLKIWPNFFDNSVTKT